MSTHIQTLTHRSDQSSHQHQQHSLHHLHLTISWRAICNSSGCGVYTAKTKPTEQSAGKIGANPAKTQYQFMLSLTVLVLVLVAHTHSTLRSDKYMQSKCCHVLLSFHRDQHSFECAISSNFSYMHRAYSQLTTHQYLSLRWHGHRHRHSRRRASVLHDKMQ